MSTLDPALALKLALATRGVRLDESTRDLAPPPEVVHPGVDLVLPGGLRVTAPVLEDDAAFAVTVQDGGWYVIPPSSPGRDARIAVRPGVVPRFYARRTSRGIPMGRVATIRGNHLLVHPGPCCGFSVQGAPCRFCLEGARSQSERDQVAGIADVVEVVRVAFEEGAADFVYLNSSTFEADDGGFAAIAPYVEAIRRHFDTLVAVQVHPPRSHHWIDRAYAMGVDALSFNLEIFDPDLLNRHCIGRARYIGRERYLDALAHAARVFPSGTVWSDLVLGLETPESTMAGIDALTGAGVVPVLSLARDGALRHDPDPEVVGPVLERLYRAARAQGIAMGWVRDLAVGITPLEARRAAGDEARLAVTMANLSRSRLGALATRGLARFRRRLRVRTIGESFDASRL